MSEAVDVQSKIEIPFHGLILKGLIALGLFGFLQWIESASLKTSLFIFPSSHLASLFSGCHCDRLADGTYALFSPHFSWTVTERCSGYDFFCITTTTLAFLRPLPSRFSKVIPFLLSLLLISYAATLVANTARLVVITQLTDWTPLLRGILSPSGIHYLIGMFIFFPALLLTSTLESYDRSHH